MIKIILFDFSRTLIFPKDPEYAGKLNDLYREIIQSKSYDVFEHFTLNEQLIDFIKPFKDKYRLVIFTTDILQNDPAIKEALEKVFSQIFAAKDLGTSKREVGGYKIVAQKLKEKPENILFIDDLLDNINPARQAGLQTIKFTSNEALVKQLRNLLKLIS